jgi:PAS domain S-box-containing protein
MKKILIIDDDASVRQAIQLLLEDEGFELLEADCGEKGLELVRAQPPDLVLSDVNMDGMDGFNVLERLRSDRATAAIPVILMTGAPEIATARGSMDRGADDYLLKPLEPGALRRAVSARLERQSLVQAQAKENERKLLEILSATQDLVAMAEPESGRLLYLNAAGRKMLGIGPEENLAGCHLGEFMGENDTTITPKEKVTQAQQRGMWLGESTLVSRSGNRIPVSKQILIHRSDADGSGYLSVVARDISERKRAEQERRTMELQLRQAQKLEAIGQLAAGIAHEINTPTQFVADNTRFLKDAFENLARAISAYEQVFRAARSNKITPDLIARAEKIFVSSDLDYSLEQIPSAIKETLEGLERVTKIVRAMKDFSHPGGKEKALADLNQAITTTVTVARNEWKYVADVNLDLDPHLPQVPCFLGELNQAILNLVVNAAHAIGDVVEARPGEKGAIMVSTRKVGNQVEIRVKDSGTGIPDAYRARIFEPFFTTKKVGKGTGQGLSIVYANIVKKHGGSVDFDTEVGKGTTFVLRLPLEAGSPEEFQAPGNAAAALK